ncbi:Tubulin monoglycylase TTLL3 [Trachymyrmex cornetzi]|uniref:Tubulin monoglycylase TTLL3 n=1 Tax=Trachymyrmex cornetzi TaxID=471704 RepID=A0A195EE34_9HYME|nr:Tubulin monoglycylase TTLL3 [Trachymyrmex cornetzi]
MESTRQNKKFRSNWKLPSSSVDLDRKDNPVNPYHRFIHARMTHPKWTLPDTNDQSEVEISGSPEFECDANSYMDACSCCTFAEETIATRHHNCCKKERSRKEAYWKIKDKIKNAVKIIFLNSKHKIFLLIADDKVNAHRRQNTVPNVTPPEDEILSLMSTIFYVLRRLGTATNLEAHSLGDITQADGTLNERAVIFALLRLEFAIQRCEEFVAIATHEDIDSEKGEQLSDEEWNYFLNDHTAMLHHGTGIDSSSEKSRELLQKCFLVAVAILEKLKTIDSQYETSDMRGIWILKPSHLCRGNGETKFDIRFVVRGNNFPSHNIAVQVNQKHFFGSTQSIYFLELSRSDSHLQYCRRRCNVELYGADFMLAEDISVWLIEINTNPRMHPPSSRLTRCLYSNVFKVIMDVPVNACADMGGFSLVYKQDIPDFQPYLGPYLFVAGELMTLHEQPPELTSKKERRANICDPWSKQQRARTAPPMILRSREPNVADLIDHLKAVRCTATN